jgi:hypothetical protein
VDGQHHLDRVGGLLGVGQLGQADHLAAGLLDPVPAGDAKIEEALLDVAGDLLGAQQ